MSNYTKQTIKHYEDNHESFWEGTKDHDVSQNIEALLHYIEGQAPYRILDFGCGPGRDLKQFKDLGHEPYGLDGSENFVRMAKEYSGCQVFHQNFLELDLPASFFDGIFANASLFHVPKDQLGNLLEKLHMALKPNGILFSSNPRGRGENFDGSRYGNYMELEEYSEITSATGFKLVHHYYRPQGQPIENCPWLACVLLKS